VAPLVSVIIISYNEKQYILDAIESAAGQSYENIEIIIGDDGSDDGSIDLIEDYSRENNIKYFVMTRPAANEPIIPSFRVSNIIKKAAQIADGKYIQILSGDDYLCDSEKIADAVEFLEKNDDKTGYVSDYKKTYPDADDEVFGSRLYGSDLWSGEYMHISCFVFRKNVMNSLLDRFCDDTGLMYSIIANGTLKYSGKVSMAYRQREKSIMHEADQFELDLIELMLFQDCRNYGKLKNSSYSRFFLSFKRIKSNRKRLSDNKYLKYIEDSMNYSNDLIDNIMKYDGYSLKEKIKINIFEFKCAFFYLYYKVRRKIKNLILKCKKVS